ncbi:MAG: hypothetical protein EOM87_07635 [Clostridia bacterium]|nr:hypothetical protein [Clostridia bacterium]
MTNIIIAISDNFREGLIVGGKLIGAIVAAALILYILLLITRVFGARINKKLYSNYSKKYISKNGNSDNMLTLEQYIKSKSNLEIIEINSNKKDTPAAIEVEKQKEVVDDTEPKSEHKD